MMKTRRWGDAEEQGEAIERIMRWLHDNRLTPASMLVPHWFTPREVLVTAIWRPGFAEG